MRPEKAIYLEEVSSWLHQSPYLIIADYAGLKVSQFSELRKRLQGAQAEIHVVKNTFIRRAIANEKLPELEEAVLSGQTAVIWGRSDVCSAAKILKTFAAEFEKPKLRAGIVDRMVVNQQGIIALADLPSREVLLAQLLGLISTPAQRLVSILNVPGSQIAQVIKAKSEKGA